MCFYAHGPTFTLRKWGWGKIKEKNYTRWNLERPLQGAESTYLQGAQKKSVPLHFFNLSAKYQSEKHKNSNKSFYIIKAIEK